MTYTEFHSWLNGFQDHLGSEPPNRAQWNKVLERINEIDRDRSMNYHEFEAKYPYFFDHYTRHAVATHKNAIGLKPLVDKTYSSIWLFNKLGELDFFGTL